MHCITFIAYGLTLLEQSKWQLRLHVLNVGVELASDSGCALQHWCIKSFEKRFIVKEGRKPTN